LFVNRLSYEYSGHSAKNEPLTAMPFMAVSGGGRIDKGRGVLQNYAQGPEMVIGLPPPFGPCLRASRSP